MVQEPILTALLIAHFLSDFTFQSQQLANAKRTNFLALVLHLTVVGIPLSILAFLLPINNGDLFFQVWLSHLAIDYCKYFLSKHGWIKRSAYSFWSEPKSLLLQLLFIILITKPVNIVFKLFFNKYQVTEGEEELTVTGAGALIGQLERLIMGIFLLMGQFTAIGLVFTAKSIARYDKISKSQAFAEYYLIGSLFSIISVLLAYILLVI